MDELVKINVDENFSMSFLTANVIYKAGGKNGGDALALYIRYIQQCKRQHTNQPYCNDEYMIRWLERGRTKFYKIKKILTDLWLIKTIRDNTDEKTYIKIYYLASGEKTEALIKQELASPFYAKMESQVSTLDNWEVSAVANSDAKIENSVDNLDNWEVSAVANRCIENRYTENRYSENETQMLKVIKINALNNKNKCFPQISNEISEQTDKCDTQTKLDNQFTFNDGSIQYYTQLTLQQTRLDDVTNILRPLFPHPRGYKWAKKDVTKALKQYTLDYDFVYGLIYDMKLLWFLCEYGLVRWPWFMWQRIDTYTPYTEKQRDEDLTRIVTYIKRNNQDKSLFEKRVADVVNLCGLEKYRKVFRSIPANREDTVDLSKIN